MRRVLITGGSGFIGTNLVTVLTGEGWEVLNLSTSPPRDPRLLPFYSNGDVCDDEALRYHIRHFAPGCIVHLAARTGYGNREDAAAFRSNTLGTENIVREVQRSSSVQRLIVASSIVAGPGHAPGGPMSYANSKRESERIVHAADPGATEWCIVRPVHVWGPWFGAPFREFFTLVRSGWYLHPGSSPSFRYLGFVGNVVHQLKRLLLAPGDMVHERIFYLGDYEPVSVRMWADRISAHAGRRPPRTIPDPVVLCAARMGDLAERLGWSSVPLTTPRLMNMQREFVRLPMDDIRTVAGTLPYTLDAGIDATLQWLDSVHATHKRG